MKTETTPRTDRYTWNFLHLLKFAYFFQHIERSRRRNIRRAWRLRKELRFSYKIDAIAQIAWEEANQEYAEVARQRDEAIQIAEDLIDNGHHASCSVSCYVTTCDCGWREDNARLEKLEGEISEHGNLKTSRRSAAS